MLAITDHNSMSGIVQHHYACRSNGVKPIYGVEVTTDENHHLTLLAKNEEGLKNLFHLCATDKSYEDLYRHRSGVIALSGDLMGAIPVSILREDRDELNRHLYQLKKTYKDDFYLEVIDHGLREQKKVNRVLNQLGVKKVRTNDVHYLNREDAELQSVLICDRLKRRLSIDNTNYHTIKEAWLKPMPEDEVAQEIALKCNVSLDLQNNFLPDFEIPKKFSDQYAYLKHLVYEGLRIRCPHADKTYEDRLEYELSVISNMGFPGYFLIVWDFVNFAHNQGIAVGPGRGSGAGSLVAYCLRITDLDPIKYNLLFERFLNPERVSMPDFDIDFCMSRRGEVIKYVVERYGQDSVCQIATFSELKPRSSWHSCARVLGVSAQDSDRFSKMLPEPPNDPEKIADVFEKGRVKKTAPAKYQKLEYELKRNPKWRKVVDVASRLEGAYRSVGRGAAGVLISNGHLADYVPVWDTEGKDFPINVKDESKNITRYVSQLDKNDSEKMGLVKFDFLGLAELDVIQYALELIGNQGKPVPDMSNIPLDDPKVFELISSGRTIGMFQVSSDGMAQMVGQMNASEFEDVVATVALYRPGPMDAGMHEVYIRRKNGKEPVTYLHPDLEPILKTTYGVILYQEQVMEIAQVVCGYTLGGADLLRRAMGKKKADEMAMQKKTFMQGGSAKHYSLELLEELWRQIETFARYGFNRSHAAAYAMITYQTAWLKAHYTAELLAAQMQIRQSNFDDVRMFIEDAKSFGVEVFEPTVQKSSANFKVRDGQIWVGLSGIQNISTIVAEEIPRMPNPNNESERKMPFPPYKNLTELFSKVTMSSKSLDSLVYSGALDLLLKGDTYQARADLVAQSSKYLSYFRKQNPDQMNLFGSLEIPFESNIVERPETRFMLDKEREFLGRYRTGHPADEFRMQASKMGSKKIEEMRMTPGSTSWLCGIVTDLNEIATKNNDLMCFLKLEDESSFLDISVFPNDYDSQKFNDMLFRVVFIKVEISLYKDKPSAHCLEAHFAYN